jgi:hypothetical protein
MNWRGWPYGTTAATARTAVTPRSGPLPLEPDEEGGETDGEGREDDVEGHREAELDAREHQGGLGVVSGIVMSYQLGTNWSRYSDFTGNVLGPLIQYEVITAFFLEVGGHRPAVLDREARRRLHPGIGREDPEGGDQRAEGDHAGRQEVQPVADPVPAEQHDPDPMYRVLYRFWVKAFAVSFGLGVVSGIVMSYQLGTSPSRTA